MSDPTTTEETEVEIPSDAEFAERVARTRLALIRYMPFFGHLLLRANITQSEKVPTACVDIYGNIQFGKAFAAKLTDPEFAAVLTHEVLHPALLCWTRKGMRDHKLWNTAHDFSFNIDINRAGEDIERRENGRFKMKLPDGCCIDPKYDGKSAEEIYDDLRNNPPQNGGWEDVMDDCDGDPTQGDARAREAVEKWRIAAVNAAQEHEKANRGDLPAGIKMIVDAIRSPVVDWRNVLSRWLGDNGERDDVSYRRPSRRSEIVCSGGEILPSMIPTKPKVIILWDTSGSVVPYFKDVAGEIAGILESMRAQVRLITCDADVHTDVEVMDVAAAMAACEGGGGSDFRPAFKHLADCREGVILAITDGDITVPETAFHLPVAWVLVGDHSHTPTDKWGTVIKVDRKQIKV